MGSYDEDLFDNPFFVAVHKQYTELFNQAIAKKGLLCVPKFSVCAHKSITKEDAEDHILLPDESVAEDENNSQTRTKTLSGKTVLILDGKLHTSSGFDHHQSVQVLFEETFHSENDNSYRVLCIGHFLNSSSDSVQPEKSYGHHKPSSYEQCLDLLWNHSGGQRTRDNLDKLMNAFADVYDTLEVENLRSVMDMASAHFTKAMQHLLKDSFVRQSAKHSSAYMDSLKVAVETYMMNAVHVRLFCVVTAAVAAEDAEINKMTRNLASLQLQDMGIRKIFSQNIPSARKELATLNRFSTPLGRLFCMKRVVTALTRPLKRSGKTDHSTTMMTTDDFLPILIFLIIKSEIPNWTANLVYMRHFHFAKCTDDDEFGFYLASVEAALEHIKSGYISEDLKINKPIRERWSFLELTPSSSDSSNDSPVFQRQPSSSIIDEFFKCVQDGDEEAVKGLLQRPQRTSEELTIKLCHPLCSCDKCEKLLASSRSNSNLVTAYTRDNRGYTALHMAAYHGQGKLIDLLVHSGAVVDATDYLGLTPLHLACQRGYQNVMLLLLHFEADPMVRDNEGDTALHHCCLNGHEDCVKGLVFYDTSSCKLQVNCTNDIGDTALHMAAKWGYENIVKILLENGAIATMKNRKHQSPIHVAQNVRVQRILLTAAEELELQPLSTFNRLLPSVTSLLGKVTRASSSSSGDRGRSGSSITNSDEDFLASRVETASLDEAQDKQLKRRKDKLFKAILDGDIQLVKFYVGADEKSDDEEPSKSNSWEDMCHPLCQCDRCVSIQKARVKAHRSLSVNVQTTSGYTPLHMAVLHHHNDLVDLFLQLGASVNTQNHKKLTALHIAACLRNLSVVVKLLERGAKINIRDINGDTPLHISCANGFVEGVQALIVKGVDVNVINNNGNTALHEAADHLQTGILRVLLEAGADPTIRNKLTQTALNLAKDPQSEKVLQAANADWQQKLPEQQLRKNSARAAPSNQVRIQELFAAFEEEDLKTLQSLTASIRSFHQQGSLRQAVTHDKSHVFLTSLARSHSIRKFDLSTLRKVRSEDKSSPLYMYSLATEGKRTRQGTATSAGTETLVRADSVAEGDGVFEDAKSLTLSAKEGWVSYFNGSVDLEIPELSSSPQMLDDLTKTGVSAEVQVKSISFLEDLDLCSKSESVVKRSAQDSSCSKTLSQDENNPATYQREEEFCILSVGTPCHQRSFVEESVETARNSMDSGSSMEKSDVTLPLLETLLASSESTGTVPMLHSSEDSSECPGILPTSEGSSESSGILPMLEGSDPLSENPRIFPIFENSDSTPENLSTESILESSEGSSSLRICRRTCDPSPDSANETGEKASSITLSVQHSPCGSLLQNAVLDDSSVVQPREGPCTQKVENLEKNEETANDLTPEDKAHHLLQHSLPLLMPLETVPETEQNCQPAHQASKAVEHGFFPTSSTCTSTVSSLPSPVEMAHHKGTLPCEQTAASMDSAGQQLRDSVMHDLALCKHDGNILEQECEQQTAIVTSPCSDVLLLSSLEDSCLQDSAVGNDVSSMLESEWERSESTSASRADEGFMEENSADDDPESINLSTSSSVSDLFEAEKEN